MALIKTGGLVSMVSGTIGGVNFANGKGCQYARNAPQRRQAMSPAQAAQRAVFDYVRSYWDALTAAQRQQWKVAAAAFPKTNRIGLQRPMSAYELFSCVLMDAYPLSPGNFSTTPPSGVCQVLPIVSLTIHRDSNWWLRFSPAPLGYKVVAVQAARPYRNTPQSHYANWRTVGSYNTDSDTFSIPGGVYAPPFLQNLQIGEYVGVRISGSRYFTDGHFVFGPWADSQAVVVA